MRFLLSIVALLSIAVAGLAQTASAPKAEYDTVDSILKAVYEVISGPAGQKRDWDKMRSLFVPEARMIAVGKTRTGEVRKSVLTVEDYITKSGPVLEERGFFEKGIAHRVEQYGNIAQVFSTYEARQKADDEKPFMRGINSFQLFNDGKRWWVVTIFWQSEDPTTQIPAKYMTGG